MASQFSSGKHSIAECDRCGFRYKLKQLKPLTIKTKVTNILVCPECWEPDHPQLQLGMYPVNDPQAVRNPRPDTSYSQSRNIQWGFNPVGLAYDGGLTPNVMTSYGGVGTVSVTTVQNTPIPPEPVSPVTLPASITASVTGPDAAESALITFNIPYLNGSTWRTVWSASPGGTGDTLSGTWLNSGTVSDYEYRWTLDAPNEANLYTGGIGDRAANVWVGYSSVTPRSYGWSVRRFYPDTGTVTVTGLLEIREVATLTVVASTTLTLSATRTPP